MNVSTGNQLPISDQRPRHRIHLDDTGILTGLFWTLIGGTTLLALAGLARAQLKRVRLDSLLWDFRAPADIKRILNSEGVEEILHAAREAARGICRREKCVKLVRCWDNPMTKEVCSVVEFDFRGGCVSFQRIRSTGEVVYRETLAIEALQGAEDGIELATVRIRRPDGAIISWLDYAEKGPSAEFFSPFVRLRNHPIPMEISGMTRSYPCQQAVWLDRGTNHVYLEGDCRILITGREQAATGSGVDDLAIFHSHPPVNGEARINELVLINDNDLTNYLAHLEHNPSLANLIFAVDRGDSQFISVLIPKPRHSLTPESRKRLMGLSQQAGGSAGALFYDEYLELLQKHFTQYLIRLSPQPSSGLLVVEHVWREPSVFTLMGLGG